VKTSNLNSEFKGAKERVSSLLEKLKSKNRLDGR
jgi:hypothetical protein